MIDVDRLDAISANLGSVKVKEGNFDRLMLDGHWLNQGSISCFYNDEKVLPLSKEKIISDKSFIGGAVTIGDVRYYDFYLVVANNKIVITDYHSSSKAAGYMKIYLKQGHTIIKETEKTVMTASNIGSAPVTNILTVKARTNSSISAYAFFDFSPVLDETFKTHREGAWHTYTRTDGKHAGDTAESYDWYTVTALESIEILSSLTVIRLRK